MLFSTTLKQCPFKAVFEHGRLPSSAHALCTAEQGHPVSVEPRVTELVPASGLLGDSGRGRAIQPFRLEIAVIVVIVVRVG